MNAVEYLESLPFPADPFQWEAAHAIDDGATVVVTAPTGSGKTVVAEAGIARALHRGERAVYTTPLKALSNQKYDDLRSAYGADLVGLLTGDNTINPRARVVIMTTEVLRNMMYVDASSIDSVGVVILDEVHYLQDQERGGVWEEIIVHLDRRIPLVCLSATVANPDELTAWVRERRGHAVLVSAHDRPVPLDSTYLVRDRWQQGALRLHPVFQGGRPNERLARMLRSGGRRRYAAPRRHETSELLRRMGLLPAIYFIFSRAGCEAAAAAVVERGLRLASASEREEIRAVAAARVAHLTDDDLSVLGYQRWLLGLEAGVAAHHAGLVPPMKEAVEILFARGLVRLVFATETLALGINMPARTVVLESLSRFTGEAHELLQPGDYTQLTGRAGRRGIDTEGTAVILHSDYLEFDRVAAIAARGAHPLRSSFRPTYNMVVNLVDRYDRKTAEDLLEASFAGFSERQLGRQRARELATGEARLAELRAVAARAGPEVWDHARRGARGRLEAVRDFVSRLRSGDVLDGAARHGDPSRLVVIARGGGRQPRIITVDETGRLHRLSTTKLPESVAVVGRVDLPSPKRSADPAFRRRVASALTAFEPDPSHRRGVDLDPRPGVDTEAVEAARAALRLEQRLQRRRGGSIDRSLLRRFRSHCTILEERGYMEGWGLTPKGQRLRRLYNERDLVLGDSLAAGLFEGLDGPDTAALASGFTFEPRRDPGEPSWPQSIATRADRVEAIRSDVARRERHLGLPETRPLEPGFAMLARRWTSGESLARLFDDELAVGDFVRNCRQLIDLLRQIADSGHPGVPGVTAALRGIDRGVVALSAHR